MLTLFKARSVITMNDSLPRASAVLVRDGVVLEVGEEATMAPWLRDQDYVVDDQFAVYFAKMSKSKYYKYVPQRTNIVNIGYGTDFSIKEVAELIKKIIGYKGKIIFDRSKKDGVKRKLLNIGLMKKLGRKPNKNFEKNLKDYINSIKHKIIFD